MTMKFEKPKTLEDLMKLVKRASEEGAEVEFIAADTGKSGLPPELAELLAGKGINLGSKLTGKALIHGLLDVVAIHNSPPVYEPGTFVCYRDYVRYVKEPRELHVVVERLAEIKQVPLTDENDGNCTSYRRYDCIVAKPDNHGGICRYLADSRELELYPDADKLLGKDS